LEVKAMFSHLLVPLDGSQLAESALPAAEYIAQTLKIPVTLVHIIEKDPPQAIHGEAHLSSEPEAKTYLDRIARTFPAGIEVDTHIHTRAVKDVAQSIVSHVDELESNPERARSRPNLSASGCWCRWMATLSTNMGY
jgi:nucleotide-binding universal stress UspA family protein